MPKTKKVSWGSGQKRRVQCIYIDAKSMKAWDNLVADIIRRQQRGDDVTISGIINGLVIREYGKQNGSRSAA